MRKALVILASFLTLVSCSEPKVEEVKKDMGIQLYSVRELIGNADNYAANHETVLKAIADMGYTAVEAANYNNGLFYGVSPEQFKADCEAAGLECRASHTNHGLTKEELASGDFSAALEWWKVAIPAHKLAGMTYVEIPSAGRFATLADLKVYCDYLTAIGKICAENGIKFGYHSHSYEFEKVEDEVMYDFMLQNTDPAYVFFQMDVYWAVYGGVSPVNYFKKYPGRFTVLHIKDYMEVGQSGMVGFDAIFANTDLAGMECYVVEMEGSSYGDILRTCKESADYLKANDFVKESYK